MRLLTQPTVERRDRGIKDLFKSEAEIRSQSKTKVSRGEKLSGAWTIPLGVGGRLSPTD